MRIENSYSHIYKVAFPIIIGHLAEHVINFTDTVVVGRMGEAPLGAVGLGSLYYYTFVFIAQGLAMGSQILIGRRNGEKDYRAIGRIFDNSIYLFSAIAVALFILLYFLSPILLRQFVSSDEVYHMALEYVNIRIYGILFICLSIAYRVFYIGITKTQVIVYITLIMASINLFFNIGFVQGKWGFPRLGIGGSALASVIAEFVAVAGYTAFTILRGKNRKYHMFGFRRPVPDYIRSILNTGLPVMLQGWFSISSWFFFFILIEKLGEKALSVSTVIKSVYLFNMIPIWGLGSATNTLVSNAMGAERQDEVPFIIKRVVTIALSMVGVIATAFFIFPNAIVGIYTDDPDIIAAARNPLWIVATATILFAWGFPYFNAVSGSGSTRVTLGIEIITLIIYLAFMLMVSQSSWVSLEYFWSSEVLYMLLMGVLSVWYIRTGKWRTKKL